MEKKQTEIALFKYSVIAPVMHTENKAKYFRELSNRVYEVPYMGKRKFKWETFNSWLKKYRKYGLDGLKPKFRLDKGISRSIDTELNKIILDYVNNYNIVSSAQLYRILISNGHISKSDFRQQTLAKYVKDNNLLDKTERTPRKRFEKEYINELWISDFLHGPKINKRNTYLCCIIDDHSRVITGYGWYYSESSLSLELTLKKGILRYGLPKVLYCDNGSAYVNTNLQLACAKSGIALVHTKPYDPASKGKIERFNRTVRQLFMPNVEFTDIEEVNKLFKDWVEKEYNRSLHTSINDMPINRFMSQTDRIKRIDKSVLDENFYQVMKRKVNKDSTVSIDKIIYEVPSKYISEYIEIRFASETPDEMYIYEKDKPVCPLKRINLYENAAIKHIPIFTGGFEHV